jgi:hypothetical protein
MTTLMRNGRDRRSGKPVMGHAILERALLVGTRSADHIRASSHSGCIATGQASARKTGRIHGCTRTLRRKVRFLLHRGHRPYMAHHDISLRCGIWSLWRHSGLWPAECPVDLCVHGLINRDPLSPPIDYSGHANSPNWPAESAPNVLERLWRKTAEKAVRRAEK